ncbi:MAG: sigma-70 family RNA polymerase sigma factor [Acidobacteria bacterium]|nr:sigma-70 family RNA polymerase sigma factor [Acidobacteriota bacterium]
MSGPQGNSLTQLLEAHRAGEAGAFDRLVERAYGELARLARRQLRRASGRDALATGTLIHEAYLRLAAESGLELREREHFFAVMARAMRFVVVDHARRRHAAKRGGGVDATALSTGLPAAEAEPETVLAVHDAIATLESFAPRLAQIVECRFFAGLSDAEIAGALDVSVRTVQREWLRARAWLQKTLAETSSA